MSKKKANEMKICISLAVIATGWFFYQAAEVKIVFPLLAMLSLLLLGVTFFLIYLRGNFLGRGRIALESDLDPRAIYDIHQVLQLKNRNKLFILEGSTEYSVQVIVEDFSGFKNFEQVGEHLVSKKLNAKIVDGELFVPAP